MMKLFIFLLLMFIKIKDKLQLQLPDGIQQGIPDGGDGELQTPFCEVESLTAKQKSKLKNEIKNKIYEQKSLRRKKYSRSKRSTVDEKIKIWNNLKLIKRNKETFKYLIPYKVISRYDKDIFKTVLDAMELISKKTCVSFVNIYKNFKKYNKKDHLTIVNAPGCRSAIGRNPGQNFLRLELGQIKLNPKTKMLIRKTCVKRRIVLHEHQRSDRDKYLKINYKNIRKDKKINFVKVENDVTWGLPYNYDSIMNYRVNAFAKNPKNLTIKIRNGNRLCKLGMGTHEHASELDFLLVNLLYNCPGVENMVDNFVDKHYFTKPSKHHHNHHHHQHKTPKSNKLELIEKSLENELKEWNKNEIKNKLNKNKIKRKSKKNKRIKIKIKRKKVKETGRKFEQNL
uniref:Metalloendopeptidase n=1 Tax=Meloidogyne enterolobii TaxID=390850 RepID=A0A6V7UM44_MELEN|nr:unnamed protein product [Meloidogyne enterolobii]